MCHIPGADVRGIDVPFVADHPTGIDDFGFLICLSFFHGYTCPEAIVDVINFFLDGGLHPASWNELVSVLITILFFELEGDGNSLNGRALLHPEVGGPRAVLGSLILFSEGGKKARWLSMQMCNPGNMLGTSEGKVMLTIGLFIGSVSDATNNLGD